MKRIGIFGGIGPESTVDFGLYGIAADINGKQIPYTLFEHCGHSL